MRLRLKLPKFAASRLPASPAVRSWIGLAVSLCLGVWIIWQLTTEVIRGSFADPDVQTPVPALVKLDIYETLRHRVESSPGLTPELKPVANPFRAPVPVKSGGITD